MTNKERLEEIKEAYRWAIENSIANRIADSDIEWLIQQAERAEVQKWQKFYKESEESHSETKELLKSIVNQNKRYREALEEIMRTETVTTALAEGQVAYTFSGHIARKALEGTKNEC